MTKQIIDLRNGVTFNNLTFNKLLLKHCVIDSYMNELQLVNLDSLKESLIRDFKDSVVYMEESNIAHRIKDFAMQEILGRQYPIIDVKIFKDNKILRIAKDVRTLNHENALLLFGISGSLNYNHINPSETITSLTDFKNYIENTYCGEHWIMLNNPFSNYFQKCLKAITDDNNRDTILTIEIVNTIFDTKPKIIKNTIKTNKQIIDLRDDNLFCTAVIKHLNALVDSITNDFKNLNLEEVIKEVICSGVYSTIHFIVPEEFDLWVKVYNSIDKSVANIASFSYSNSLSRLED